MKTYKFVRRIKPSKELDEAVIKIDNTDPYRKGWLSVIEKLYGNNVKDCCNDILTGIKGGLITTSVKVNDEEIAESSHGYAKHFIGTVAELYVRNKCSEQLKPGKDNNTFPDFKLNGNEVPEIPVDVKYFVSGTECNGSYSSGASIAAEIKELNLKSIPESFKDFQEVFKKQILTDLGKFQHLSGLFLFVGVDTNENKQYFINPDHTYIIPIIYSLLLDKQRNIQCTSRGTVRAKTPALPKDGNYNYVPACLKTALKDINKLN